ncbi:peptidase, S8/S53 family [Leptospira inadai serovar Lyme str. 10]|uniref:Peptidase, S8/S53 family n=2 Tax=Leptospira inadai serovar Lyme TaxID=293084 RepID=V6HSM7_9LEPT|nr:S8 family serine peptidase [Leptospira inadai]EQA35624.1 peptidase, S8/S53 family [Leptospira inadai serovar Lyme str. 10]PNV74192.1 peptidase [Leptospira inadai serovar Lyme]
MRNVSLFSFFNAGKRLKLHSAFLSCLLILFVLGGDCPSKDNTGSAKAIRILFSPETKNDRLETNSILGLNTHYWADANSDGIEDLCYKTTNLDLSSFLSCSINHYGKFSKLFKISVSSGAVLGLLQPKFTDITGDGIPDYCGLDVRVSGGNASYSVRCISIVENKKGEYIGGSAIEGTLPRGFDSIKSSLYWVDINGDKRSDYCYAGNFGLGYEMICQISEGNKFVSTNTAKLNFTSETAKITFPSWVDIDGDADKDFTWIEEANGRIRILFMKNEGGKFGSQVASDPIAAGLKADDPSTVRWWTDWNGDGKLDFCYASDSNTIQCLSSTGNGFASAVKSGSMELGAGTSRGWIDANNDGKADFCRRVMSGNSSYYYTCTLSQGSSFGGVNEPGSYKSDLHTDPEMLLGEGVFKNEKWIQAAEETGYPMHCAIQGLLEPTVCQLVRKEGSPLADDAEECDPSDQTGSRQKRGTENDGYQKADCKFTSGAKALLFKTLAKQVWNYLSAYYSKKHDPEITVTVVDDFVYLQDQSLEYRRVSYNNDGGSPPSYLGFTHGSRVASVISDRVVGAAPGTPMIIRQLGLEASSNYQEILNWLNLWNDIRSEEDPIVNISISIINDLPDTMSQASRELLNQYYEMIRLIGRKNKSILVAAAGNLSKPMNEFCERKLSAQCYDAPTDLDRTYDPVIRVAALSQGSLGTGQTPQLAHFSNFGAGKIDIAAPGEDILVNSPNMNLVRLGFATRPTLWDFERVQGTSYSAPLVAATLVQMKKCQPNATAQQLKAALLGNADKIDSLRDKVTEGRVLNSVKAISVFCAGREEL